MNFYSVKTIEQLEALLAKPELLDGNEEEALTEIIRLRKENERITALAKTLADSWEMIEPITAQVMRMLEASVK